MKVLFVSDLHLTARPQDAYRWGLFPWLIQVGKKHKVAHLFILGDLTDFKDHHPAKLVHDLRWNTMMLANEIGCQVSILMGNHDYTDPQYPFFEFLNYVRSNIQFVTEPYPMAIRGRHDGERDRVAILIPHVKGIAEWEAAANQFSGRSDVLCVHQTVEGAIAEAGARLNGLPLATLAPVQAKVILAGDIHRPQVLTAGGARLEYVGAPYKIRFGDDFIPRVILRDLSTQTQEDLHFPSPDKRTLRLKDVDEFPDDLAPGDQIKITLELTREELPEWPTFKKQLLAKAKKAEVEVFGVELKKRIVKRVRLPGSPPLRGTDSNVFQAFCNHENLPSLVRSVGKVLMED